MLIFMIKLSKEDFENKDEFLFFINDLQNVKNFIKILILKDIISIYISRNWRN